MEPRIQYAKTKDGVSIAFSVMGRGVPLVHVIPHSHFLLFWGSPVWQPWLHGLARRYQLVLYDPRGNGLSQRGLTHYTAEKELLDLAAVVDRLALDRFVVFACYGCGHGAIEYAVKNPGRVAGLVLWASFVSGAATDRTHITLVEANWQFYLQVLAQSFNWLEPREVRAYVDLLGQCITQEDWLTIFRAYPALNVEHVLPQLHAPALVLHPKELITVKAEEAVRLASLIPDARLVLLDGPNGIPVGDLVEPTLRAVHEFIQEVTGGEPPGDEPSPGGAFRTVLFTDIEGSTVMTQRLGDAGARQVLREHERISRECLKAHGGSEVKTMGDGFMASFTSATKALECAIAMQRAFAEWNAGLPAPPSRASGRAGGSARAAGRSPLPEPIRVRIGLNAGEPIAEEEDLFGTAVIMAARIAAQAKGGEVLASNVVRELVAGKGFLFADRGDAALRGFDDPVRLYEVRWLEG